VVVVVVVVDEERDMLMGCGNIDRMQVADGLSLGCGGTRKLSGIYILMMVRDFNAVRLSDIKYI